MAEPQYTVAKIESKDSNYIIYDISTWKPEVYAYIQQLLSQEMDLDYPEAPGGISGTGNISEIGEDRENETGTSNA